MQWFHLKQFFVGSWHQNICFDQVLAVLKIWEKTYCHLKTSCHMNTFECGIYVWFVNFKVFQCTSSFKSPIFDRLKIVWTFQKNKPFIYGTWTLGLAVGSHPSFFKETH